MFTHWDFIKFLGRDPFGLSGLDIKGYYLRLKRAEQMLFERIEAARDEDGTWKLSKVIPREEFRDFF
jgi:hypothetical protein